MTTQQTPVLTVQEAAFAAEHHHQISLFLSDNGLTEDDYYDIAVFGYLQAVCDHFRQKVEFLSHANALMLAACNRHDSEQALCIESMCVETGRPIEELIADTKDAAEAAIEAVALEQTLAVFDEAEKRIVELLLRGYPCPDIASMLRVSMEHLQAQVAVIQTKTAAVLMPVAA